VAGLGSDGTAIVIATPEHHEAFADAIGAEGVDVDAAARDGRYMAVDAVELFSTFMIAGTLDPVRF
jgi:hypothetical protein